MSETNNNSHQEVKDHLDQLLATNQLAGIQYAVVDANSILFQYAGGLRDAATPNDKVMHNTQFLVSSCTKVLTAAAVLKLVESNQIHLEDPLSMYFSHHPYGDAVQIQHLLNHSSGIPNPMPIKWLHTESEHASFDEAHALADTLKANPNLDFPPGDRSSYSNLSYWLLGRVIEEVSGKPYAQYMTQEVFEPLGITPEELGFEVPSTNYARGHQDRFSVLTLALWMLTPAKLWDKSVGRWARFQPLYMNGPAYGGAIGTALGLAKFLQDMLQPSGKLLSSTELAFGEQADNHNRKLSSTLGGWHIGTLKDGKVYYSKPGGGPGYSSNVRIYPGARIATLYLSNKTQVSEGAIGALSDELDHHFLK